MDVSNQWTVNDHSGRTRSPTLKALPGSVGRGARVRRAGMAGEAGPRRRGVQPSPGTMASGWNGGQLSGIFGGHSSFRNHQPP